MCMLICKTITSVLTAFYCKGMSSNFLLSSCCPCVLKFQIMSRLLVVSLEVCFLLLFSFFSSELSDLSQRSQSICFVLACASVWAAGKGPFLCQPWQKVTDLQCPRELFLRVNAQIVFHSTHLRAASQTATINRDWSKQLKRGKVWVKAKTSTEWDFIKHFKKTKNNFNCKKSACVWVSHICWWLRVLNIPLC